MTDCHYAYPKNGHWTIACTGEHDLIGKHQAYLVPIQTHHIHFNVTFVTCEKCMATDRYILDQVAFYASDTTFSAWLDKVRNERGRQRDSKADE
jgi:hypothetical protein